MLYQYKSKNDTYDSKTQDTTHYNSHYTNTQGRYTLCIIPTTIMEQILVYIFIYCLSFSNLIFIIAYKSYFFKY